MLVILDNGHGYDTYGKASPVWDDGSQLFEWEFNRDIVKRIHAGLKTINIESVILVPESLDIYLRVRAERANSIYKKNNSAFLISIHGNKGMNPNEGTGWEVWTSPGDTESDSIATKLYESAEYYLKGWKMRSDYTDGDPDKESRFYILAKTLCPAVLTENLFYDNIKDCRFMLSNEGRNMITMLHIDAIMNYRNTL
jgi:N-acetylmuramoyl-L-alanine amidase